MDFEEILGFQCFLEIPGFRETHVFRGFREIQNSRKSKVSGVSWKSWSSWFLVLGWLLVVGYWAFGAIFVFLWGGLGLLGLLVVFCGRLRLFSVFFK